MRLERELFEKTLAHLKETYEDSQYDGHAELFCGGFHRDFPVLRDHNDGAVLYATIQNKTLPITPGISLSLMTEHPIELPSHVLETESHKKAVIAYVYRYGIPYFFGKSLEMLATETESQMKPSLKWDVLLLRVLGEEHGYCGMTIESLVQSLRSETSPVL
jgi:hypothetical protein